MKHYMVPDDPSFQEKGDPFPSARKKSKEEGFGNITPEFKKQRQKDYRKHGVGGPLSVTPSHNSKDDIRGKILVPKATKNGVVYVVQKKQIVQEVPKKLSKQAKRIKRFKEGLK